ncbi:hypothetical protein [Aureimonas sp. AU20]|uniref:hypothetical protein n=1 Tax=Aureimonas sp. AU20 TaxID=1349819 RepID=UPI000784652D|nr:hypothetical protein [Aureimonas sp. AU20]
MSVDTISIGALADAMNAIETAPRSRRAGVWTRAVRRWRRQLLAAGLTEPDAEFAIGRAFTLAWQNCAELREVTPRPSGLENGPQKAMGRFNLPPLVKRKKYAPRPATAAGAVS